MHTGLGTQINVAKDKYEYVMQKKTNETISNKTETKE